MTCCGKERREASNRMLKKSASGVLSSLKDSTYRSVRLASSLAAALLDSLFEPPEVILAFGPYWKCQPHLVGINRGFPQPIRIQLRCFRLCFVSGFHGQKDVLKSVDGARIHRGHCTLLTCG